MSTAGITNEITKIRTIRVRQRVNHADSWPTESATREE